MYVYYLSSIRARLLIVQNFAASQISASDRIRYIYADSLLQLSARVSLAPVRLLLLRPIRPNQRRRVHSHLDVTLLNNRCSSVYASTTILVYVNGTFNMFLFFSLLTFYRFPALYTACSRFFSPALLGQLKAV